MPRVVIFAVVLAGCTTSQYESVASPSAITITGAQYGLDLSAPSFADLSCDENVYGQYKDSKQRAFCVTRSSPYKILFFVKKEVSLEAFVRQNAVNLGTYNIKPSVPENKVVVTPLSTDGKKQYYHFAIGDTWKGYQGVFAYETPKADELGVFVVVLVRNQDNEEVRKILLLLEKEIKIK